MQKLMLITVLSTLLLLLSSCVSSNPQEIDTSDLQRIENLSIDDATNAAIATSNLRLQGLKETALTFGAQSALAYRSNIINANLKKNAMNLRNVFNFNALLLNHNVLPPVLVQSTNALNYAGPNVLRISDTTYKIDQQAKFVTTAPTWRTYLWMNYAKPEVPHKSLLPRTKQESVIWKENIRIGWKNGERQAHAIFAENLARLKRDYNGMLLYRELLEKHMISKPFVAKTNLGVTGDGNSLSINDQVLRITSTPQLQTDSNEWKPILVER